MYFSRGGTYLIFLVFLSDLDFSALFAFWHVSNVTPKMLVIMKSRMATEMKKAAIKEPVNIII